MSLSISEAYTKYEEINIIIGKYKHYFVIREIKMEIVRHIKGSENVRADFMSRIEPTVDIAAIEVEGKVVSALVDSIPKFKDLHFEVIGTEQRIEFPGEWEKGELENDSFTIMDGVLFSYNCYGSANAATLEYPRLLLPEKYREMAIERAHLDIGHMTYRKTYLRLIESYFWKGMGKDIRAQLGLCAVCQLNNRKPRSYEMGEMPIATYPIEIISMDLVGPFIPSNRNNRYILTIICHCTGYAEAIPIMDKTSNSVLEALADQFISRHGVPEVILTDNGTEFTAKDFERYLEILGIKHKRSTPGHPAGNGRIERFNRTLKEMINKLVNNVVDRWESVLSSAMLAYRSALSDTTGFTPFYLMYGRNVKLPFATLLNVNTVNFFDDRINNLASAFRTAKELTGNSRKFNRDRLAAKASSESISIGDSVMLLATDRITFASRWDPKWIVKNRYGKVLELVHQESNKEIRVNVEKVRLVNPHCNWDSVNVRMRRNQLHQMKVAWLEH